VVIVNWNAGELLTDSVASVHASDLPDAPEVVVVDNHSTDDSVLRLRDRFPGSRLIQNEENRGFARASNQGILASGGEYILQLNPDALLRPQTLRALSRLLDSTPDAGAVGPQIVDGDGRVVPVAAPPRLGRMLFGDTFLARLMPSLMALPARFPLSATRVPLLSGCCMLLRRKALHEAGLLNERIFLYYDEADLLERFQRQGWRSYYLPEVSAIHLGERSTSHLPYSEKLLIYKQSAFELWRSRYGPLGTLSLKGLQFLLVLLTLVLAGLRKPFHRRETDAGQIRFYLAFLRLILGRWHRADSRGPRGVSPRDDDPPVHPGQLSSPPSA
jgi:GT2 family glycosyltransferase